ncbi:MAG: polyprenyl diphosphate synthase [Verrucomicrobiota bacterium]
MSSVSTVSNQPSHVAIIMDGNGRWARKRFLPRIEGHRQGVKNVRNLLESLADSPIRYLTLFAFSAENWQRPEEEVEALMDLLKQFLRKESHQLVKNRIRLETIGRRHELPEEVSRELARVESETKDFNDHVLTLALNYGSRTEVVDATAKITAALQAGVIDAVPETWEEYQKFLYTGDLPDPDLIIRTSGEWRVSNFLLLQGAYAELYFCDVPWPEFTKKHFDQALESYASRERRFGKVMSPLPHRGELTI